jgi:hypothetical protein
VKGIKLFLLCMMYRSPGGTRICCKTFVSVATLSFKDVKALLFHIVVCFPHAGTVEVRSLETGTNRRTSVYSSLLCNARNRRKSSHASLAATQHSKHISVAVSHHATIAAAWCFLCGQH